MHKLTAFRYKALIVLFNSAFLITGLGSVIAGSDITSLLRLFNPLIGENPVLSFAKYGLLALGAIVVLIAMCGFLGAWQESKHALTVYVFALVILFLAQAGALVVGAVVLSTLEETMRNIAMQAIQAFGLDDRITSFLNKTQTLYSCCGLDDGTDYTGTNYDRLSGTLQPWPETCCTINRLTGDYLDRTSCLESPIANPIYTNALTGCFGLIHRQITRKINQIFGLLLSIMASELFAITCSSCIICNPISHHHHHHEHGHHHSAALSKSHESHDHSKLHEEKSPAVKKASPEHKSLEEQHKKKPRPSEIATTKKSDVPEKNENAVSMPTAVKRSDVTLKSEKVSKEATLSDGKPRSALPKEKRASQTSKASKKDAKRKNSEKSRLSKERESKTSASNPVAKNQTPSPSSPEQPVAEIAQEDEKAV